MDLNTALRRTSLFVLALCPLAVIISRSSAQCTFDPTITPSNPILCPDTQDTLSTQVYDSYQWYKDGILIPGATNQTLIVDAFNDGGATFTVEATDDGCTEMSPGVLVDGWVFLLPFVITEGTPPLYVDGFGQAHYCPGDTVILILGLPYDTSIQWTDSGVDILGATDDTLFVFQSGLFSVSGAPSLCPDFLQQLGVTIGIVFDAPVQPVINPGGVGEICASPPGLTYQWYENGFPIPGGDTECIPFADGSLYTVFVTYLDDCSILSDPFISDGLSDQLAGGWSIAPVPAGDLITFTWSTATIDRWELVDATGRVLFRDQGRISSPLVIDVSALSTGRYWLRVAGVGHLPIAVVH